MIEEELKECSVLSKVNLSVQGNLIYEIGHIVEKLAVKILLKKRGFLSLDDQFI